MHDPLRDNWEGAFGSNLRVGRIVSHRKEQHFSTTYIFPLVCGPVSASLPLNTALVLPNNDGVLVFESRDSSCPLRRSAFLGILHASRLKWGLNDWFIDWQSLWRSWFGRAKPWMIWRRRRMNATAAVYCFRFSISRRLRRSRSCSRTGWRGWVRRISRPSTSTSTTWSKYGSTLIFV